MVRADGDWDAGTMMTSFFGVGRGDLALRVTLVTVTGGVMRIMRGRHCEAGES